MLGSAEIDLIASARGEGVCLVVHGGRDAELGLALADTARQLAGAGVGVGADHGDGAGLPATPALVVTSDESDNAVWCAAPDGPEAAPFAEHVAALLSGQTPPAWTEGLVGVEPAELLVFVAPTCPHCPNAVRVALAAARACPTLRVVVVDVQRHEELAARYKVTAVPLTVLDGGIAITGVPEPADLVARLRERDGVAHDERLFASLVESGRLGEAARVLTGNSEPFVAAWKGSTTSARMGLLLIAETVLERDGRALDDAIAELALLTRAEDAALRGDTADLLGQIGHPGARSALEALLADENPDVAEIAGEALAALRG